MAYDPLAALANSSTMMRRPMAQGGYPALSYGAIQNPIRGRRSQMGGYTDQYGAEPGSYAAEASKSDPYYQTPDVRPDPYSPAKPPYTQTPDVRPVRPVRPARPGPPMPPRRPPIRTP